MRAGKFYVNKKQVEDESVLDLIFNMRFTPVLVEYNVMTGMYEYSGTSSLFDEIEYGDMTPEYNIITTPYETRVERASVPKTYAQEYRKLYCALQSYMDTKIVHTNAAFTMLTKTIDECGEPE